MPGVSTQPSQYLRRLDDLRNQAKDYQKDATKKLEVAQRLLIERSEYVKQSVDMHIGFCINPKKEKVYRAFVSWYDHALDCRLVFDKTEGQIVAVLYPAWSNKHELIQEYRTDFDLSPGLVVLRQSLQVTKKPAEAIIYMLATIGYMSFDINIKPSLTTELLYNKIVTSSDFYEVKNEEEKD